MGMGRLQQGSSPAGQGRQADRSLVRSRERGSGLYASSVPTTGEGCICQLRVTRTNVRKPLQSCIGLIMTPSSCQAAPRPILDPRLLAGALTGKVVRRLKPVFRR